MPETSDPRSELFAGLEQAVREGVFPGCVALVWKDDEPLYHEAHGVLATHAGSSVVHRPTRRDTVYDLASLTKVLCTTTLTTIAIAAGKLRLEDPVPAPFDHACPGARAIDLLEHCAGVPAHRELFLVAAPGDRAEVLRGVAETRPTYPVRERSVYSDLGFMMLGAWLERLFDAPLDDAFERYVTRPLGCGGGWRDGLGFRPIGPGLPGIEEAGGIAPTEVYDARLHAGTLPTWFSVRAGRPCAHGEVHDDNAYVMGGVAAHAGLFGPAEAVGLLARAWLDAELPDVDAGITRRFFRPSLVPGSTRRVGWDGESVDGGGSTGGALGPGAVGHTGYTGTSVWLDPAQRAVYVLLSNRVHPTRANEAIRSLRRWFHQVARRL